MMDMTKSGKYEHRWCVTIPLERQAGGVKKINDTVCKGVHRIIERCGEPVDLAHRAKAGGCNHILVKLADGVLPYYGRNYASPSTRDFTMELVAALRDEGIEPIAWQYLRLSRLAQVIVSA
jgi:hypothetical protein